MLTRRRFLKRALQGSSLFALSTLVPQFLTATARAAVLGKDNILVVLEMTGGNDGLNTVIPFADDHYQRARPTLRLTKEQVVRVNDMLGLNPGMRSFEKLLSSGQLAIVQGVGYPNPDRSHFESMDIWQSADPQRKIRSGWVGRGMGSLQLQPGSIPGVYIGQQQLPLALHGASTGVPTIHPNKPYDLELSLQEAGPQVFDGQRFIRQPVPPGERTPVDPATKKHLTARRRLIEDVAKLSESADNSMLQFVQRSSLQTYTTIDRLRKILEEQQRTSGRVFYNGPNNGELTRNLNLIAQMIAAEFGTRIFYVSLGGFDTHANEQQQHQQLLQQIADGVTNFFAQLEKTGHAKRVVLLTFSEFGRRVDENGSRGTDHGAASCLFVAGPAVQGGVVGAHPSLAPQDLLAGDLKHHTDFRQVYATLLDGWLGCDSRDVLGGKFEPVPLLRGA